ncbi:transporter [Aspergillus sp. HF37]|nr:transporter [Aspergillus sp. HF37]
MVAVLQTLKRVALWFAPSPKKSSDGRDQWPSRAAFLLATMGGCAGQGNLLRYPSVLFNNYGLQWFIPYLLAIFLVAIPTLMLEISIGQAFRGGTVVAMHNINRRLKGVGMGPVLVSFFVTMYFIVNLAWIMMYFRYSFTSPLPWQNRIEEFYRREVVSNPEPIAGSLSPDHSAIEAFTQYPGIDLIGETVGWTVFIWFLVWLSIFRGVGMTGRVVYFTMGLPIVTCIILVGRACSLENAREGINLVWRTWRGDQLATGSLWQTAVGQVFFSTGIGFGYFTSYASYNAKYSNAVMDANLICGSNVLFENFAAFAIFGVVGYLRKWPWEDDEKLGSFTIGFLTLPEAVLHMPGANFWSVIVFFTLIVLGFSSAFVMVDVVATVIIDTGIKVTRPVVVTTLVIFSFLCCLPYCTEFGYYLLSGVDSYVSNMALIFVVWSELISATTIYRWDDVVSQTGLPALLVYNFGYFGGQIIGISVAHGLEFPPAGAGAGFGIFVVCTLAAVLLARTPEIAAPKFWGSHPLLSRIWYLAFYSGNQIRRDLNAVVGTGGNWRLPRFWPILLRYVSAPALAIIFSFAFPDFHRNRYDPLYILGFIIATLILVVILLGLVLPRYYDPLMPVSRRDEGSEETVACELKTPADAAQVVGSGDGVVTMVEDGGEAGLVESPSADKSSGHDHDGKHVMIQGK